LGYSSLGKYLDLIESKILRNLSPVSFSIEDESHLHVGHSGLDSSKDGETHFKIFIVSEIFTGLTRIQRQRFVYDILKLELKEHVHALSLTTLTPDEAGRVVGDQG